MSASLGIKGLAYSGPRADGILMTYSLIRILNLSLEAASEMAANITGLYLSVTDIICYS